jgi:porin
MGRSWDDCANRVRFCTAALLLFSVLALRADEIESSGVEPTTAPPLRPTEEKCAPAPPKTPATPWSGDIWTRSQMTGDWFGSRTALAESGLTFLGDFTQYYQGVAAGGLARQFEYGGRADYLIDVDSRKLGLWQGGHLDLRGETRLGQDINAIDGVVAPSNFAMALPRDNQNVTALTGLQYTQDLSKSLSIFFGKLNLLDGTPAAYDKGMRLNYFLNSAMQNNLSRTYLQPSTLGAGFVVRDEVEPVFNFYLLDTHYTPTTTGLPTLFSNGVLLYGEYRLRTNWFDLPGHSAVGFLYSDAARTVLDLSPYAATLATQSGATLETKTSAWTASYRFDQVLYADSEDPKRSWTLNGDFGLTDGNPNPFRWFGNLSLVGGSPIPSRANDTVGIGYYHLGVSTLPVLKNLGFGAEDGVELFYNAAVTPWFHVTPDLQIIDPAQRNNQTAILVGIRGRLSF